MREKSGRGQWAVLVTGVLCVVVAISLPSAALVETLRPEPGALMEPLLLGATLFRIGLVVLGLVAIVLSRMPIWHPATASNRDRSGPRQPLVLGTLAAILIAALALRLYGLDAGLWHDEITAYVRYFTVPVGELITTYESENQHFLYSLLAHGSVQVAGASAWAVRLPAVLFGVGSIGALYLLGRQVTSAREALLASALVTFSYHHIWFSQNARGYTGLLFWTLLASWLLLRSLQEHRPQLWLLYAAAAALGVFTHLTMLFVIAGHFVIYLSSLFARRREMWPGRWAGLFLGFGIAGLLTFQLHALVLPQVLSGLRGTVSVVTEWKQPLWTLLEFFEGLEFGFAGSAVAIGALAVFGTGLVSYARTYPSLVQLLLIPPLAGASLVVAVGHHLWPRFFFFAMGFAVLVAIRGALMWGEALARRLPLLSARPAFAGIALCLALIAFSARSVPFAYGPKQDFAGALAFVESSKGAEDAVVTVGLATFTYQQLYKRDWPEVKSVEDLNAVRSRARRTWLLYTLAPQAESVYPEVMATVHRDFRIVKEFDGSVGDGTVFVCLSDSPPSASAGAR